MVPPLDRTGQPRALATASSSPALFDDPAKWIPADDIPAAALATARTVPVVVATVDVDTDRETTFRAFTDASVFSRWLGVPVAIEDDRFSCTMEWGTRVRGAFECVSAPALLAIRWDFEDDAIPIPGAALRGYVRFWPLRPGCRVEVHQLVDMPEQAEFMEAAWSLVLGRLKSGVVAASDPGSSTRERPARPKRRRSA
jgi:uncharacterized protein YndB with AHSA1/START domain